MNFAELTRLQRLIDELLQYQVSSLTHYHIGGGGFRHKYLDDAVEPSKASTATCVASLAATRNWEGRHPWSDTADSLIEIMLRRSSWTSAGLPKGNPFTVAFLLEAVGILEKYAENALTPEQGASVSSAITILQRSLRTRKGVLGAAHLQSYPPTTFLTQLVVRTLQQRGALTEQLQESVAEWSWRQIEHELALFYSHSPIADAYSLAYSTMLFSACSSPSDATPGESQILRAAVDAIFSTQQPDGSWPRSRPLFHYPKAGNAYCYEYEMLTQLLKCDNLREYLLLHLPKLALATERLRLTHFPMGPKEMGWASGHHPQLRGPESWSTASAYHFLHVLNRLLAEAFRRSVFDYIGAEYLPPTDPQNDPRRFAPDLWDSEVEFPADSGVKRPLKDTIFTGFVRPVADCASDVAAGKSIPKSVPISAIFFGPPGTSKTQLADHIAKFLGWPRLTIDPSHLVRKGLDQIQAETNTIFDMLASIERVVVLLDEFDEMVRDRADNDSEMTSRFLTTAMLPKLALVNERRRIVFILATNHLEKFDFAIRRSGRFDITLPVMPPTYQAKCEHDVPFKEKIEALGLQQLLKDKVADLTYPEFKELSKMATGAATPEALEKKINECYGRCTLAQKANDKTWKELCKEQSRQSRLPSI